MSENNPKIAVMTSDEAMKKLKEENRQQFNENLKEFVDYYALNLFTDAEQVEISLLTTEQKNLVSDLYCIMVKYLATHTEKTSARATVAYMLQLYMSLLHMYHLHRRMQMQLDVEDQNPEADKEFMNIINMFVIPVHTADNDNDDSVVTVELMLPKIFHAVKDFSYLCFGVMKCTEYGNHPVVEEDPNEKYYNDMEKCRCVSDSIVIVCGMITKMMVYIAWWFLIVRIIFSVADGHENYHLDKNFWAVFGILCGLHTIMHLKHYIKWCQCTFRRKNNG